MPRYEKSDITRGMFLTLDAAGVEPVYIHKPAPPSYGSQPFAEVSAKLDAARARLDKLAKDVRDARRR